MFNKWLKDVQKGVCAFVSVISAARFKAEIDRIDKG
jgi:hypothetical protein